MNQKASKNTHMKDGEGASQAVAQVPPSYDAPKAVDLGNATGLIRNSSWGGLRDYTNSWYIPRS